MPVFTSMLALTLPYLLGNAIDRIREGRPQSEIVTIVMFILGLAALQGVGEFFARYLVNQISRVIEYDLRNDLFAHLQKMQQSFFQQMHTGDMMARATNDLQAVRGFLGPGISNSLRTVLMFLIASVLMVGINLKLALILLFFMPMVSVAFIVIGRKMHERF